MSKYVWSWLFRTLNWLFAFVAPFAFVAIKYGAIVQSQTGMIITGIIGALIGGGVFAFHRLKDTAENGTPMERVVAREVRFLIPLIFVMMLLSVIHFDLLNIVQVLGFSIVANFVAIPFRVVGYRLSKRYEHDMAALDSLAALKAIAKKI